LVTLPPPSLLLLRLLMASCFGDHKFKVLVELLTALLALQQLQQLWGSCHRP
jgi:hypothetical protein